MANLLKSPLHRSSERAHVYNSLNGLILAVTFLAASQSFAASQLEEVIVTANRADQQIAEVASNISFVSGDDLDLIDPIHINEAMHRVAGAWISRGNGQEHLTGLRSPVFTGAGGCGAFLMAQDGIPLRANGFCNINELFDAHTEQAARIEVIKGPGSVLYGSNAMHGLINIIMPAIDREPFGRIQVEAGPHDYYRTKVSAGDTAWRVDASGTTDAGYKDDSGFDQQKLTAKAASRLGDFDVTTTFTMANLNQETAGYVRGDEVYKDAGIRRDNPNPEAFRDVRSARLYSRMEKQLNRGALVLTPYLRYTDMDFLQHFLPGQALEENGHKSAGLQGALYFQGRLDWVVGLDGEFTDAFLKETQPNVTEGSPFLVETIYQGTHYDYEVNASTLAAFIQISLDIGDRSHIVTGARLERVHYDYDNLMLAGRTRDDGTPCGFGGCRFNRPADREDSFTNFSPKLGWIYDVNDDNQLYARIARGYRAPQATELYRLQAGQNVSLIDSEQLDSLEAGIRGRQGALGYEVSAYTMKKDNFIFRDSNRTNVDNGETSHLGVEIALSYAFTDSLTGALFWSRARHEYDNNPDLASSNVEGNLVDTAPEEFGSANLSWHPSSKWLAELEWIHMGEYWEDPENLHQYEGHDLLNLRVSYHVSRGVETFVRILNLTDERYAERADFSFGEDRYFVGEPASIYLGFNVQI